MSVIDHNNRKPTSFSSRRFRSPAFTLVEIMAALLLSGMVLSVTAYTTVQSLNQQATVKRLLADRWDRARFLMQFEKDLAGGLTWLKDVAPTVRISPEPNVLIEIVSLASANHGHSLFPRRLPAVIRYEVAENEPGTIGSQILRKVRFLTDDSNTVVSQPMAAAVSDVKIERYEDKQWTSKRVSSEARSNPQAVRLSGRWVSNPPGTFIKTVILSASPAESKGTE